jgi:hypothetical protein
VPRIADQYTDCAVYIYKTLEQARNGEHYGGSGFLVGIIPDEEFPHRGFVYVVTNTHVIAKAEYPVIRFNRKDGSTECIPTKRENWFPHLSGDDISVFPITVSLEDMQVAVIGLDMFVTQTRISDEDIGIGDDTVMIGRFVNHEGKQQNSPAVRFGNIAMMDREKIVTEAGIEQEAFLVEMRSLPGYSGSAVLIYSPCAMNDMSQIRRGKTRPKLGSGALLPPETMDAFNAHTSAKGPYLLGIDFCHIQRKYNVRDAHGAEVSEGLFVMENTGMAGVIPAWRIAEVLDRDELKDKRKEKLLPEKQYETTASLDTADDDVSEVFTQRDFEAALKKVSRKVEKNR